MLERKHEEFRFVGEVKECRKEEMAKGGENWESYQPQVTWMEQKARNQSKLGGKAPSTARRRRISRRAPRKKVLLDSAGREAMMCKENDPVASSTGYSTDAFERDEEQFIKDLEWSRGSRRSVSSVKPMVQEIPSGSARNASFVFQKRNARIDWRSLHSIDVDRLIREVGNVILPDVHSIRCALQIDLQSEEEGGEFTEQCHTVGLGGLISLVRIRSI